MCDANLPTAPIWARNRCGMLGFRSGRLVVIEPAPTVNKRAMWKCRCDCGKEVIRMGKYLRSGEVKSCGCLNRQGINGPANFTHGHTSGRWTRTYGSWAAMLQRCTNPKNEKWPAYGGRGICVCDRWRKFANFLADMGNAPAGKTLERRNVNGNYDKQNCRWATPQEQGVNTRQNRRITFDGETRTLSQWARLLGWSAGGLHARLKRLPLERALMPKASMHE